MVLLHIPKCHWLELQLTSILHFHCLFVRCFHRLTAPGETPLCIALHVVHLVVHPLHLGEEKQFWKDLNYQVFAVCHIWREIFPILFHNLFHMTSLWCYELIKFNNQWTPFPSCSHLPGSISVHGCTSGCTWHVKDGWF